MADAEVIPIFPLHTVLFPGGALPLHIFEPRYRLMIARCLEAQHAFGVVLIKEGREVGNPATPYRVGTRAKIVQHERLEDGRLNLLCIGVNRFRLIEPRHDEPYLTASVEPLEESAVDEDAVELADRVRRGLDRFLASARRPSLRLPGDPTALSFALAAGVPMPLAETQALLELTSTSQRLAALLGILDRETRLRRRVGATRPSAPGHIHPLSSN